MTVRPYTAADGPACAALDVACPFELADGTRLTLNRGAAYHSYLQLMGAFDAWVLERQGEIIGFYSNSLRPVRFNNERCFAVYQHHWRVHPAHRSGSLSGALVAAVDSRRTFEKL